MHYSVSLACCGFGLLLLGCALNGEEAPNAPTQTDQRAVHAATPEFGSLQARAGEAEARFGPVHQAAGTIVERAPSGVLRYIDRRDSPSRTRSRLLILVSIDGLAPYVRARAKTPTLDRLSEDGTAFSNATTVSPSTTLTAHASMLSGLPPERHGVLWNRYDAAKKFAGRTVFTSCGEHGLRCAMFVGKDKFVHFAEAEPGVQRYELHANAPELFTRASAYIREERPDFVFIHVAQVDSAGHAYGWDSAQQVAVVERVDAHLGQFMGTLPAFEKRPLTVIVTSDHGGHGFGHEDNVPRDLQVPWIGYGDGFQNLGATSHDAAVSTMDTASTVLALLNLPVPEEMVGKVIALRGAQENVLPRSRATGTPLTQPIRRERGGAAPGLQFRASAHRGVHDGSEFRP